MTNKRKNKYLKINFGRRKLKLLLDKVLIFRFIRNLHGRFWGVAAVAGLGFGLSICFLIRPDMLVISTAYSDFGNDIRTAPYFSGAVFFAAYGLWRWRNYVARTLKHSAIFYYLLSSTILGLYLVALMPVSWHPWPYRIHVFGFALAGLSIAILVIIDGLISKTRRTKNIRTWRLIRILSFVLIVSGGILTLGSIPATHWFDVSLLGETLMLAGFALWIYFKTYVGEGAQSKLSILARKIGLLN
jgi:hypothetical protein